MYDIVELKKKLVSDLRSIAKEMKLADTEKMKKQDLVSKILDQQGKSPETVKVVKSVDKPVATTTESRATAESSSDTSEAIGAEGKARRRRKTNKVEIVEKNTDNRSDERVLEIIHKFLRPIKNKVAVINIKINCNGDPTKNSLGAEIDIKLIGDDMMLSNL